MATNHTSSARKGNLRRLIRQYRNAVTAVVEGLALLLRLPLVVQVVLNVATQLVISFVTAPRRRH